MKGLIIQQGPLDKILDGKKQWEIRGSRTHHRGTIALIQSKSGKVFGVCDLADCIGPLTSEQFRKNARKAGLRPDDARLGYYRTTFAWALENPRPLSKPVAYVHPAGAVIWVELDARTSRSVLRNLP